MADLSQYVPRLPFNTLAQFEAVSGLMILNVDADTFVKGGVNYAQHTPTQQDIELYSTINHEMYHYFQTLATGYQYLYVSEMWRLIVKEANAESRRQLLKRWKDWVKVKAVQALHLTKRIKLESKDVKRLMGFEALARDSAEARQWEEGAGGDFSLVAASKPSLAHGFDKLWARVTARNAEGLSALDLIEGSAIIYEHQLTRGGEGLENRLASAWDAAGETYRKAHEVAQAICGSRALDVVLPAAALALRYSNPPDAYPVFLTKLKSSPPGAELSEARALAADPPRIPSAGRYLGTALDVRRKQRHRRNRYQIYDDVLDKLAKRAWGSDEIDLLADPGAAQKVASFPFLVVVKEGPLRTTDMNDAELIKRLICGSLVLRTAKVPRYRREAEKHLIDRAHAALASVIDPLQAASEYTQLGVDYLNRGDLDQAEAMFDGSLAVYQTHGDKQGMAQQYYNLGLVYASREDKVRAEELYRMSLELSEAIGDQERIAQASANLGVVYMKSQDWDQAEAMIRKALAIEEALGLKEGMAIDYCNLGRISHARGNLVQSEELLTKSSELYQAVGNSAMAGAIREGLEEIRARDTERRHR